MKEETSIDLCTLPAKQHTREWKLFPPQDFCMAHSPFFFPTFPLFHIQKFQPWLYTHLLLMTSIVLPDKTRTFSHARHSRDSIIFLLRFSRFLSTVISDEGEVFFPPLPIHCCLDRRRGHASGFTTKTHQSPPRGRLGLSFFFFPPRSGTPHLFFSSTGTNWPPFEVDFLFPFRAPRQGRPELPPMVLFRRDRPPAFSFRFPFQGTSRG